MKKNNKKGFTLAELLIVVAIIAVLTAIAIPIFTSQLERSREATDLSNTRSYYAEITSALLTGDLKDPGATSTTKTVNVGSNLTATLLDEIPPEYTDTASFRVQVTGVTFQQGQSGWQTAEFEVAGVKGGKDLATIEGWNKDDNAITYTYKLAADGDYYLSGTTYDKVGS